MIRTGTVGKEIVDERAATYGDPVDMYTRSAAVVTGILGVEVQPWQVPLIMAGLKLVRTSITPDYSDNSDDVEGYIDIFRTLIGEDMVHASSAKEYQQLKEQRDNPMRVVEGEPLECANPRCAGFGTHHTHGCHAASANWNSENLCMNCGEPQAMHEPIELRCQARGHQTSLYEEQVQG